MNFAVELSAWSDRTKAACHDVVRESVVELATRVVKRSPVDTGLFRGNWRYGLGRPPQGLLQRLDKTGDAAIATIRAAMPEHPAGLVHYITNNQPYGVRLEHGWSRQAPAGMVGISVEEWPQIVAKAVKSLGVPA